MGWAAASVLVPVAILAEWSEANIVYVLAVLLTYVLIWSGLELSVGLHLRARARRPIPA
jgi:predicted ABC-type sugar transport system permease subunit